MNFRLILSFFCLVTLIQCTSKVTEESNEIPLFTLEVDKAELINYDQLVNNKSYILLSTDENAVFSRVDKLVAANNQFYLFDALSTEGILVFDNQGTFLRKIGEFGDGPELLNSISDFQVNESGEVMVHDRGSKSIFIYDSKGALEEVLDVPFLASSFSKTPNGWIFSINVENQNESMGNPKVSVTNDSLELQNSFFKYHPNASNIYFTAGHLSKSQDQISYFRAIDDTVSLFNKQGELIKRFKLDFGSKNLPQEAMLDMSKMDKSQHYRYIAQSLTLIGNRLFGFITSTKTDGGILMIDLKLNKLFRQDVDYSDFTFSNLLYPSANLQDEALISYLDPVTFSQDSEPENYPEDVREHLKNEGSVLIIHHLKPVQ